MGRRLDGSHIKLPELFNVFEHLPELRPEFLLFFGREIQARQMRNVFNIQVGSSHDIGKIEENFRLKIAKWKFQPDNAVGRPIYSSISA